MGRHTDERWIRSLVSVRKQFESFESFVIQSGDLVREGHHRCGQGRTADVTTAANCDIRAISPIFSADMDSFDFKMRKPDQARQSVMRKWKTHGKITWLWQGLH